MTTSSDQNKNYKPKPKKYKYKPRYKNANKKPYSPPPKVTPITRMQYFKINILIPTVVLSILIIGSLVAVFKNENGGWFVFFFSLSSLIIMLLLANKAYKNYLNVFKP
jgi:hypothetical protein